MNGLTVTLGGEELVRRVVLQDGVDVTSVVVTSDDDQTAVLEGLGGGVPTVPGHLQVSANVGVGVLADKGLGTLSVLARVVGTGFEHSDGCTSVGIVVSAGIGNSSTA